MILARNYKATPVLGKANPNKTSILKVMKSGDVDGLGEGYVRDFATGSINKGITNDAYILGDLFWRSEDTYNFEFNDMELSPEFCARALELIGQASA